MKMMKQSIKFAVAQFGAAEDPELMILASEIGKKDVDWYLFDETADKEFELRQLKEHYDFVYWCEDAHNFTEVR